MKQRIIVTTILITLTVLISSKNACALVDTPWGPERTTYTWANPAPYATFNSITDNPQLGDERNFVRVWEVGTEKTTDAVELSKLRDEITLEVGKTYGIYIYYHNNADAHDVGKTALGIADGAAMKSSFPATIVAGETGTVTGTVFASDTNPLAVWDGVYLKSDKNVYLRYVTGSAIIHNGGTLNGSSIGPDYLFGDGALLGYNKISGILPGCNEYAGYVTYWLFVDAPDFQISKSVVGGATIAKPGDEITFKVRYDNTGTMTQTDVVVRDMLGEGLEYVAGSAKLYNNNLTDGKVVNDDLVTQNGMNIGSYAGGSGWAEVTYMAKVKDDVDCSSVKNWVTVSTNDGNKNASVEINVDSGKCGAQEDPDDPDDPEDPDEIVKTGPAELIMAIVITIGICGGGYYYYRTQRVLRATRNMVVGSETEGTSQKPDNMIK